MQVVALWIMLSLVGFIVIFLTAMIPFPLNAAGGIFGGFMMFMSILQMLSIARFKGFLALFKNLKENEQFTWLPDYNNKLRVYITQGKHKGLLYREKLGILENKGTNFSFGNDTMSFAYPHCGYTVDLPTEHYFSKTKEEDGLESFDEHVKAYLGETKYIEFKNKFRKKDQEHTIDDINRELDWICEQNPENKLEKNVFGYTVDFSSRCKYLRYNYDPVSALNATEREKLLAYKEGLDYRERVDAKYMGMAKAAAIVLMALMIFLIVLSSIDLGNLGGLFG